MKKRLAFAGGFTFLTGLIWGVIYIHSLLPIITGYPAKYLCSAVFVSNRNPAEVEAVELNFSFIRYVTNDINYREKSVTSHFLWGRSKAICRDGFGSTLLRDVDESSLRAIKFPTMTGVSYNQDTIPWPLGNIITDPSSGSDKIALTAITEKLMVQNTYKGNAFAFLVVHHGIPVAEHYKPGFSAKTRFLSWSMAKSVTNALAGIMVKEGMLDIDQRAGIPSWQHDDRSKITINDLMQMQSGLRWNEDYATVQM